MKRGLIILVLGLIVAGVAYGFVYFADTHSTRVLQRSERPELAWLKGEFNLSDAEFKRVCKLDAVYMPECREMCRKIDDMNARLQHLIAATNVITPEIKQALAENAQCRTECEQAMLTHFYTVAQAMPPQQGKRYLAWAERETLMPGRMPALQLKSQNTNKQHMIAMR